MAPDICLGKERGVDGPEQTLAPDAARVAEVSFDAAGWELLEREATRLGVTVEEYVHEAALMGAGERRAEERRVAAALARQDIRDEAAAVRAESRQARCRAAEVRGETNAILDTVVLMVTEVLRGQGFALLEPVVARFRTADSGNTGVDVAVHLEDPSQARAAKAAIVERFPDRLSQVTVA